MDPVNMPAKFEVRSFVVARVGSVQWTDHRKWEKYSYRDRPTLLLSMPNWRNDKKLAIRLAYNRPTASSPNVLQIPYPVSKTQLL